MSVCNDNPNIVSNSITTVVAISLNTLFETFIICHSKEQKADKNYFILNETTNRMRHFYEYSKSFVASKCIMFRRKLKLLQTFLKLES